MLKFQIHRDLKESCMRHLLDLSLLDQGVEEIFSKSRGLSIMQTLPSFTDWGDGVQSFREVPLNWKIYSLRSAIALSHNLHYVR